MDPNVFLECSQRLVEMADFIRNTNWIAKLFGSANPTKLFMSSQNETKFLSQDPKIQLSHKLSTPSRNL